MSPLLNTFAAALDVEIQQKMQEERRNDVKILKGELDEVKDMIIDVQKKQDIFQEQNRQKFEELETLMKRQFESIHTLLVEMKH